MRVASVTNTPLDPGLGSGKTVQAWTQGIRQLGHDVAVFPPNAYYRPWPGEKAKRMKMRLDSRKLENQLLREGYDLVEFYGAEFGPLIDRLASRPRSQRPLLVAHTNGLELLADKALSVAVGVPNDQGVLRRLASLIVQPWIRRSDLHAFSRVDAFAAICELDLDHILAQRIQAPERCAVVEPGVDEVFLQADWKRPKAHRFVSIANWTERKDPQTLMAVASYVMERDSQVEFHVLGAWGSAQLILDHLPQAMHSRTIVHPRLSQEGMIDVLTRSKAFLFPSLYEGFGMATTEAMACGCGVVVTPTGFGAGIRNEVDGLVCPFKDRKALSLATLRLLNDEAFRRSLTERGRERVECQTWDRQVKVLESTYRRWLAENPSTPSDD